MCCKTKLLLPTKLGVIKYLIVKKAKYGLKKLSGIESCSKEGEKPFSISHAAKKGHQTS